MPKKEEASTEKVGKTGAESTILPLQGKLMKPRPFSM